MAIQCWWDDVRGAGGLGITACLGIGRSLERGTPASCMGDTPTLLAMTIAEASLGAAHYTEVDAVDRHRSGILLSNGGEIDPRLAEEDPSPCENQFLRGALGRGVAFDVRLRPGPASLIGFTELDGSWRVITSDGHILDEHLIESPVPRGFFAARADPEVTWARLVEAGMPTTPHSAHGPLPRPSHSSPHRHRTRGHRLKGRRCWNRSTGPRTQASMADGSSSRELRRASAQP